MPEDDQAGLPPRQTAQDVLDDIRARLTAMPGPPIETLVQLATALQNYDGSRMSADDAAAWQARPQTQRETFLIEQSGQKSFKLGFLWGAGLCSIMAAIINAF